MALAYDDYDHGNHHGNCVVLIHGHPFDRTLWDPQVTALRDSFRVLARACTARRARPPSAPAWTP